MPANFYFDWLMECTCVCSF